MDARKQQSVAPALGFDQALLPNGWTRDVVLRLDAEGFIQAVERGADAKVRQGVEWTEGSALPGMANVHSHAHQRLMTGLAERSGPSSVDQHDTFWTWREAMFSFVERLSPEQLEAVAAQAYVEMLEAGFTAVGEFQYLHNQPDLSPYAVRAELSLRCLAAARSTGIAITMLPVLYSRGGFDGRALVGGQRRFATTPDQVLEIVQTVAKEMVGHEGHERLGLAPHSLRAVAIEDLREAAHAMRRDHPGAPIHVHVAEQTAEVTDCLAQCSKRPVERLLEEMSGTGTGVDGSWCLIHATHLSDAERSQLAYCGAVVGLCPTTEANLGDGVFAARDYLAEGGRVAIGTDSQIRISVAEDLRQLENSQRLRDRERNVLAGGSDQSTGRRLFDAARAGGARALDQPMSGLEVGQRADIVVLDPDHSRLIGRSADPLIDSWVFAGDSSCVRDVYVGGVLLVQGGRHIRREEVMTEFRARVHELG